MRLKMVLVKLLWKKIYDVDTLVVPNTEYLIKYLKDNYPEVKI